jgi:hypothetical protein
MRSFLTARATGLVALAALAGCGSQNHSNPFNVGPGNGVGAGDDGGPSGDDDSGLVFTNGDTDGGRFISTGNPGTGGGGSGDGGAPTLAKTSIDSCTTGAPSGLSAASVKALLAGGSAGMLRYLYPYSGTVFPRGLIAPTLMWDGDTGTVDYVYVHIKSSLFEYKGCLAPTAAGQILLPQDVWAAAGNDAHGASDPFSISLTLLSSGAAVGPITEPIVIAPATLKGSVYYNTYQTKLLAGMGGGGAVLRMLPGQAAQVFLGQSGCTGCHAVSADGTRMTAQPLPLGVSANGNGATYSLTTGATTNPKPLVAKAINATFTGISPDGSLYIGNAHPNGGLGGPRAGSPGTAGPANAAVYETDTGNLVADAGVATGAMMPTFSPDGKQLVFTDDAISNGQGLATMSFDKPSRTATNYKKVFQVTSSNTYPGWPFFLPDDYGVVFAIGSSKDYSGNGAGLGLTGGVTGLAGAPTSDLYVLDLASGTSTLLAQAMGFATVADAASNTTYLPFGASQELHHNYDPTVSPVAAGGYFWIFFDSYRHYGNVGLERQLWGTAVDVSADGKYTTDPSHPPFFVTGQELGTGNHRAFTALDPCHADGMSCTTGVDCCNGFCTNGVCGVPTPRCSNVDETCTSGHTCCDSMAQCINGFCEIPIAR